MQGAKVKPVPVSRDRHLIWKIILCSLTKEIHVVKLCNSLAKRKHTVIVSYYANLIVLLTSYPILSWNLVTQIYNIIGIYPGTSVHRLPHSLWNYKEEAKIKPSENALAMTGHWNIHHSSRGTFEVGGGEKIPGVPNACATRNFSLNVYCRFFVYTTDHINLPKKRAPMCVISI